ncbi:MAG TPA: TRAP transporter TatT component family protein [Pyrinomonadaceae bacterium]|nr:TRAP transporter TatT component family protein [Pyrinomonadaceae bacterium]
MGNLRKNSEKLRSALMISASVSLVFVGLACRSTPPQTPIAADGTDSNAAATRLAEAEALYQGREDLNKARVALAALRQARTADYTNFEVAWKLSRAAFYVGDHTDSESERDDAFREGIEAGKAAIALQPNKPDGHFWLGANYGGSAAHSTLASLSSFHDIQGEMEAVLKLDESYQGYSAYLGLGRLYRQAPRVLGGDSAKAIEYLEKGVKLRPNNTTMRVELAEAYAAQNRDADARKQIEAIQSATPDPQHLPEHKAALAKAEKLLQRIR